MTPYSSCCDLHVLQKCRHRTPLGHYLATSKTTPQCFLAAIRQVIGFADQDEWERIPRQLIRRLTFSMSRRVFACIGARCGHKRYWLALIMTDLKKNNQFLYNLSISDLEGMAIFIPLLCLFTCEVMEVWLGRSDLYGWISVYISLIRWLLHTYKRR